MVRLALENSDWICASSWESDQPKFVAFSEVTKHHDRYLNEQLQRMFGRVRTMFLCGGDLIKRCGLQDGRDYWICAGLITHSSLCGVATRLLFAVALGMVMVTMGSTLTATHFASRASLRSLPFLLSCD